MSICKEVKGTPGSCLSDLPSLMLPDEDGGEMRGAHSTTSLCLQQPTTATTSSTPTGVSETRRRWRGGVPQPRHQPVQGLLQVGGSEREIRSRVLLLSSSLA